MTRYGISQPVTQVEAPRLVTGRGRYTDDVNLPRQAAAIFLRSPHAHADIVRIDTSAAEAIPGVLAVLTGDDYAADGLGEIIGGSPLRRRDGSQMYRPPRPALTRDRVRHERRLFRWAGLYGRLLFDRLRVLQTQREDLRRRQSLHQRDVC